VRRKKAQTQSFQGRAFHKKRVAELILCDPHFFRGPMTSIAEAIFEVQKTKIATTRQDCVG
jgi:hypothetical protein